MTHVVYVLHSQVLNRFYIGYSADLELRLEFHQNADLRKFTYRADDWTLFFTLECSCKKQALQIEKHIKNMKSKTYIHNLVLYPEIASKLLNKYLRDC